MPTEPTHGRADVIRGRHEARRYRLNPRASGRHEDVSDPYSRFVNMVATIDMHYMNGVISLPQRQKMMREEMERLPAPGPLPDPDSPSMMSQPGGAGSEDDPS